jgi:hypothetical protein
MEKDLFTDPSQIEKVANEVMIKAVNMHIVNKTVIQ